MANLSGQADYDRSKEAAKRTISLNLRYDKIEADVKSVREVAFPSMRGDAPWLAHDALFKDSQKFS
jgi:hypothetical protein